MGCDNCDRLRRQVRELTEELAEHERKEEGEDSLAFRLKKRFRLRPQHAKVLAVLIKNAGRVVQNRVLIDASDYEGEANNPNDRRAINCLSVMLAHIRRALEDAGMFDVVQTFYGQGRMISKEDSENIRSRL